MNVEIKVLISLIISAILIALNVYRYHCGYTSKQRFVKTAQLNGNFVMAKAVKNTYQPSNNDSETLDGYMANQKVIYEYEINSEKYTFDKKYTGYDQSQCTFPLETKVYYDAKKLQRKAFDYDVSKIGIQRRCLSSGIAIFVISTFLAFQILKYL